MAIVERHELEGQSGFTKKFEPGSEAMLFDFVQSNQYSDPIRSAIREIVSNGVDSIVEKKRFFDIQSGKAKVEDFYIQRDGDLYRDSNYNPDYYDEKWLSKTENTVQLVYEANNNSKRDYLHIKDVGVGLGGLRMEKHFNPLYSTKRNNNQELGKFGIGSKAGLALEVDYYTLITRYNGCEFHFNVYAYKVDPTVPRLDTTTGKERGYYEMQTAEEDMPDGTKRPKRLYYYPTTEPNGVEVILQVKKGLRKEFIDGIKGQLLYLDGIEFFIHENGQLVEQTVKAEIEYQDDIFVLPTKESTFYSKPHLIINNICYGYIDFLKMEEEDRAGNIGIKVNAGDVDVNQNRESVRWTEKTRNTIHSTFKKGEKIAEDILAKLLTTEDLIDWVLKCGQVLGNTEDKSSVIGRFSNVVDIRSLKPQFAPLPKVSFTPTPEPFFPGYEVWIVKSEQKWSKSKGDNITSLGRTKVRSWGEFNNRAIYYQDADTKFRQEMFMLTGHQNGFIKIIPKGSGDFKLRDQDKLTKADAELLEISFEEAQKLSPEDYNARYEALSKKWINDRALTDELIRNSVKVDLYSSVQVPESYRTSEKEDEEDEAEAVAETISGLSPAEQRKLENRIVATGFHRYNSNFDFNRIKFEPRIKEVIEDKATVIYGFQEDEANLCLVAELFESSQEGKEQRTMFYNNQVKIVMISQSNAKYYRPHIFVNDFFMNYNRETKTISMNNKLVQWQTARKINQALPRLNFLRNFGLFDSEATAMYEALSTYHSVHYMDLDARMHRYKGDDEAAKQVIQGIEDYADKVSNLQIFIAEHPGNLAGIAALSKALFDPDEEILSAVGIDVDIYNNLMLLLDVVRPVEVLLNRVDRLTTISPIDYHLEQEIKGYLAQKGYISLAEKTASQPTLQTETAEVIEA